MSAETPIPEICRRVEQIRRELHGDRGKVRFAKQLGISPSTYNYYEIGRVPPAGILVKISDVGGVDLRWLLTGEQASAAKASIPADHPAIARIVKLLADHPDAAGPLTAFVNILAESLSWPVKTGSGQVGGVKKASAGKVGSSPDGDNRAKSAGSGRDMVIPVGGNYRNIDDSLSTSAENPHVGPAEPVSGSVERSKRDWIPILGRSAAGVPQFWSDADQAGGVTVLCDLVARYAGRRSGRVVPAVAGGEPGHAGQPAQIITMTDPSDDSIAEFVSAGVVKGRYPDAFAVRIDGDSMSPAIRHGDVVICSASATAADGSAAVVQLSGQIGVTCKVFRRAGDTVHLIPINEQYAPQSFPGGDVVWARRVLACVRPG